MVERRPWLTAFSHLVLIVGVLIVAFPVYITFVASTQTSDAIVQSPMPMLPGGHLIENYTTALTGTRAGSGSPRDLREIRTDDEDVAGGSGGLPGVGIEDHAGIDHRSSGKLRMGWQGH
ncbi:MAG TPA: hypothetical protein PKH72_09445, partial [Rhodoferax sp.]|nr:hypothetical protein [Rhodoferax sp.]